MPAPTSKYEKNYTTVYEATVAQVAKDRHIIADNSFPELKREDYPSDDAYREALVKQYQAMRAQEYNYVVQNESMKAFNVSYGSNQKKRSRCENQQSWNGYPQTRADSCFTRTQEIAEKSDGHVPGENCCAISATSLTAQISGKMGYDGKDNLIKPKSRVVNGGVGPNNNPGAAKYLNKLDSIPKDCRINYNDETRAPTLNEAIKKGIIKVGDEFSIKTGEARGNITTGCHAMVLADVQYAADGKTVVGYTLQGNNPPTLKQVDASAPDYYGSRKLVCVTQTNDWVKAQDAKKINGMSAEQLQEEIAATRQRISSTIDEIQATETEYVQNKRYAQPTPNIGRNDGYGKRYNEVAEELHHTAENLRDEQLLGILEQENARREAELKEREEAVLAQETEYNRKKEEFLAEHPDKEEVLAQKDKERAETTGTPEHPEAVAIPEVTNSEDLEERKRNAMERKAALDKKEEEIGDREFNVSERDTDLILERAGTPLTKAEKKKAKEEKRALAHAEGIGEFKKARGDAKVDEHEAVQEITQPQRTIEQNNQQTVTAAQPVAAQQTTPNVPETWEMTQDGKLVKVEKDKTKPKTEIGVNELIERMRQRQ